MIGVVLFLTGHCLGWQLRFLMMTIILFESWHALCHARPHLLSNEDRMVDITHSLYLLSMTALACVVLRKTTDRPLLWIGLFGLVLLDLYTWSNIRGVWMIFSGLLIAVYLIIVFYSSRHVNPLFIVWILSLFTSGMIMLYNEKKWCLQTTFPLHVMTEAILSLIIISTLSLLMHT